ncbi:MAG: hypothetical protein SPE09_04900 [Alloprevotella sp.]|nr:hypothetical protein [Alloprevotella sp.]
MTNNEYNKTRKAAVDALIYYWAKTGMREFTMRDAVNDYLEASGANLPSIGGEKAILAHRKIAANRLAIDCIYALSKEELSKVDRELEGIVGDWPRQSVGVQR